MANDYEIKDSGERKEYSTGAVRDVQRGKGRFDLLPMFALEDLAKHYEKGCKKYGENNYLRGIPISRFVDSGMRHLVQFIQGKEDEGHLISAIWNLIGAKETLDRIELGILPKELDDLPYPLKKVISPETT